VQRWLVAHPRFVLHFTSTSASWLNLVERLFGLLIHQAIRRDSFDSIAHPGAGDLALPGILEAKRSALRLDQERARDQTQHPKR